MSYEREPITILERHLRSLRVQPLVHSILFGISLGCFLLLFVFVLCGWLFWGVPWECFGPTILCLIPAMEHWNKARNARRFCRIIEAREEILDMREEGPCPGSSSS